MASCKAKECVCVYIQVRFVQRMYSPSQLQLGWSELQSVRFQLQSVGLNFNWFASSCNRIGLRCNQFRLVVIGLFSNCNRCSLSVATAEWVYFIQRMHLVAFQSRHIYAYTLHVTRATGPRKRELDLCSPTHACIYCCALLALRANSYARTTWMRCFPTTSVSTYF